MKTCYEIKDLAYPIVLKQRGRDNFTLVYGKQIRAHLSYAEAGCELGLAVMHALACESKIDNRHKGEK